MRSFMNKAEILAKADHTLLSQTATLDDILAIVDDGIKYGTASVCIPSCYVADAVKYANGRIPICTVVGFPNGNCTTEAKAAETEKALSDGAKEIDMVINIGLLKAKKYDYVLNEIKALKELCGERILKVIIETCLLTDEEKIIMCGIVSDSGADFIKTSTGFSKSGATREDIKLFSENVRKGLGIKAAGGIRSFEDAEDFIKLGATRLGTSALVKLMKSEELSGY